MANRVTPSSPYELSFTGVGDVLDGAEIRQRSSDPANAAAKAGYIQDNQGWGSRIVALLKKAYSPILMAKVAIVCVSIAILFILKPKSYRFLDVVHTLMYGRPNSVTKPGSDEVLVQREATKAMRIIAVQGAFVRAVYLYYDGWTESAPEWKNVIVTE
eukprot:jgi/Mesvir1/2617/Mv05576-RA.1